MFSDDKAENKKRNFVPYNRDDLLNKIESLKLADDGEDGDFSFDESDLGSDFGSDIDEE